MARKRPKNKQELLSKNKKKAVAKKAAVKRKSRVEKPFNSGTMSSSMFFNWIRQMLRRKSMYWRPIGEVRNACRIPYKGPNKRRKWSYICSGCKGVFEHSQVAVHHIEECGTLTKYEDLPGFVQRLFCEKDGLILLCGKCHDDKHKTK
jgi:hypothetical protein